MRTLRTIRPVWLVVIALVAGAAGWVTTQLTNRASLPTPVLPLSSLLTMGVIVAVLLFNGIRILRWRNGKRRRRVDPILAVWTLLGAQACAYAGSLLAGWHLGILADQLPTVALRSNLSVIWFALAIVGGGLIMIGVGLIVERFCRIPPEDGPPPAGKALKRESNGGEEYA